jgi:hypothetical protein
VGGEVARTTVWDVPWTCCERRRQSRLENHIGSEGELCGKSCDQFDVGDGGRRRGPDFGPRHSLAEVAGPNGEIAAVDGSAEIGVFNPVGRGRRADASLPHEEVVAVDAFVLVEIGRPKAGRWAAALVGFPNGEIGQIDDAAAVSIGASCGVK